MEIEDFLRQPLTGLNRRVAEGQDVDPTQSQSTRCSPGSVPDERLWPPAPAPRSLVHHCRKCHHAQGNEYDVYRASNLSQPHISLNGRSARSREVA